MGDTVHIRARRFDVCFELAQLLSDRLGPTARVVDEVHGFRYFEVRDVLGFVDGTENPEGLAAPDSVLIGAEDPDFANGSYVIVQKYLHDLDSWNELSVAEQEEAFGRSKLDDLEFADERKAPDSHLTLNTIVDASGEERQIMRFNMPFGRVGTAEFGTYFVGYARTPDVIEEMLENMFIGKPAGTTDRILDFSTAVTGGLFFVPSLDFLDDPPEPERAAAAAATPAEAPPAADDEDYSLGIGSLKQ